MPGTRSTVAYVYAGICSSGLAIAVAGTFLSWLRSGDVRRNSYEMIAIINHFALVDDPVVGVMLQSWIGFPLVSAICAGLFALRLFRTAATIVLLSAILVGTILVLTTVQGTGTNGPVGVAAWGPITTTVGMAIAALAALGVFAASRRRRHRNSESGRTGVHT